MLPRAPSLEALAPEMQDAAALVFCLMEMRVLFWGEGGVGAARSDPVNQGC